MSQNPRSERLRRLGGLTYSFYSSVGTHYYTYSITPAFWNIKIFNRAHAHVHTHTHRHTQSTHLTCFCCKLSQAPSIMYVCMLLSSSLGKLWGFPSERRANLRSPGGVMRWDNLFGFRALAGTDAGSENFIKQAAQMTGTRVPHRGKPVIKSLF